MATGTETGFVHVASCVRSTHSCTVNDRRAVPQCPRAGHTRDTQDTAAPRAPNRTRMSRRRCMTLMMMPIINSTTRSEKSLAQDGTERARRSVLDEERELYRRRQEEERRSREQATRAAFAAVAKAGEQLDDVQKLVEDGELLRVATFSRLFNDAVVREGMQKVARKLDDREQRTAALEICAQTTAALKRLDGDARAERTAAIVSDVKAVRALIQDFVALSP
ncbi:hypothetical protein FGB62_3g251 [Gracilaria domingensis]|nr:hypothetical protein FGB62_3g251 [Gracilaria domingensis]